MFPILKIMLHIPKIDDHLKIFTGDEVKDFVVIDFGEYLKYTKEKNYSKLNKEQSLRKVFQTLYISPKIPDEVEKYVYMMQSNSSDNCVHQYNIEIFYTSLQLN